MNIHWTERIRVIPIPVFYFDEHLVLVFFDSVNKSPGFFPSLQVLDLDLQVIGLLGLRGLYLLPSQCWFL